MKPSARPRVKVCCIASPAEAALAVQAGASALGLVSHMPSGPGVISEEQIAAVAAAAPPGVATFLLTCLQDAEAIVAQQRRTGAGVLQLCDRVDPKAHAAIRRELPGIKIVQVVHVAGEESLAEAREAARTADALLLDSGKLDGAVKELGGTGRRHDWAVSRRIREEVAVPLYLAGGLTAANVGEAIAAVGPFGLDLCSGVRTDGALDAVKLAAFMAAVAAA